MKPAGQMTVTLTLELEKMVRAEVKTGPYASNSEVIREALRQRYRKQDAAPNDTPVDNVPDPVRDWSLRLTDWPVDHAARFWALYPNKVGKRAALTALERVRKQGVPWAELMAGLQRYVAKTDDRPWCHPTTWLNQDRWTDEPATVVRRLSPREQQQERMNNVWQKLEDYTDRGEHFAEGSGRNSQEDDR